MRLTEPKYDLLTLFVGISEFRGEKFKPALRNATILLFEDIGDVLISHRETNRQLGPVLVSVS